MMRAVVPEPNAELLTQVPATMTYEEFLAWADEDTWAEWVEGEVIELSPALNVHQAVSMFLSAILKPFADARNLGELRAAPFQMKTGPDLPAVSRTCCSSRANMLTASETPIWTVLPT